jgi:hypothetical protein
MDCHFTQLRIGTNRLAMALNRRRNSSRNQSESQLADGLGRRALIVFKVESVETPAILQPLDAHATSPQLA